MIVTLVHRKQYLRDNTKFLISVVKQIAQPFIFYFFCIFLHFFIANRWHVSTLAHRSSHLSLAGDRLIFRGIDILHLWRVYQLCWSCWAYQQRVLHVGGVRLHKWVAGGGRSQAAWEGKSWKKVVILCIFIFKREICSNLSWTNER